MRDKQQVARQFSRAAASYDSAAGIQQRAVSRLLEGLTDIQGHWLDIGCGTGVALPHLRLKGADTVTGVDLAEGMLASARVHTDEQTSLLLADADDLPLENAQADGLLSSLMLQWSEDPANTLREWRRVLKSGARLAITTLLPGTQREIQLAWQGVDNRPHVNEFSDLLTLNKALTDSGFSDIRVETECLREEYDSLTSLLRCLKQIGATNVNPGRREGLGGRSALNALEMHYPTEIKDGQTIYPLSYEVVWIFATAAPVK